MDWILRCDNISGLNLSRKCEGSVNRTFVLKKREYPLIMNFVIKQSHGVNNNSMFIPGCCNGLIETEYQHFSEAALHRRS